MPRRNRDWSSREVILAVIGVSIILAELTVSAIYPSAFHYEFVIAGCALCGVSYTQLKDRK